MREGNKLKRGGVKKTQNNEQRTTNNGKRRWQWKHDPMKLVKRKGGENDASDTEEADAGE